MKKLIGLLGSFGMIATSAVTIISCGKDKQLVKDLTKLIKNTKLGALDDAKEATIIAAVITKNLDSGLKKEDIEAKIDKAKNKATITPVDTNKFTGSVEVTFTIKSNNLADIIKNKELGYLDDAKEATIIAAVITKNPDSGLTKEDIKATVDEKNNKATIAVKNTNKFIGTVEVTFKIKTDDLSKVVVKIGKTTTYGQLFEDVRSQLIKDIEFDLEDPTNTAKNDFAVGAGSRHMNAVGHNWTTDIILEKDTAYFDFNPTEKGKTKLKNSLRVIVKRDLNMTWISKDDPNKNLIQEDQKSKTFKITLKDYDDLKKYDLRIIHFPALESEVKQVNSDKTTWKLNWSDINTTDNTKPIGNFVNLSWCDGNNNTTKFDKNDFEKISKGSTIEELKFESENLNGIYKILFIKG
ncbi:lipoprotein [Spiroplasma endosymbiont of Crioceris asparagi]|uniref:lipoprotein n=1 Tax=Spiroplasma endosymbiont of Crioceris asparagi TaxID=3066286 RepID=UPI0030D1C5A4